MTTSPISVATPPHFGWSHPLADVAARHCFAHTGHRGFGIGRVACGRCWERAIRDDERFAIEHELPRELVPDPDYIDEIAVRLACRGERVTLTPAERVEAVRRLHSTGMTDSQIARRLHTVRRSIAALATAPIVADETPAELRKAA